MSNLPWRRKLKRTYDQLNILNFFIFKIKKLTHMSNFPWRRKSKRIYGQPLKNTKFHRHHHTFISFGAEKRSIIINLKKQNRIL